MSQNPDWVEARDGAESAVMYRTAHHSTTPPVSRAGDLAERVLAQEGWVHSGCGNEGCEAPGLVRPPQVSGVWILEESMRTGWGVIRESDSFVGSIPAITYHISL